MKVRFLGSGDAFGSGGRLQTCIHLASGAAQALVDCGASSLIAMRRFGVDPSAIDAVILSHLHGDHFGGVPFLILDGQFTRRARPLVVAGPPGVEARVHEAMEVFFPGSSRIERRFDVRFAELSDRVTLPLGSISVTPFGVIHASGAPPFALRVVGQGGEVPSRPDDPAAPSRRARLSPAHRDPHERGHAPAPRHPRSGDGRGRQGGGRVSYRASWKMTPSV